MKNREEVIRFLEKQRSKYQYIVREPYAPFLLLFSSKPKKYTKYQFWGYPSGELDGEPAIHIDNTDITEISWSNRSPKLISEWLEEQEEGEDELEVN